MKIMQPVAVAASGVTVLALAYAWRDSLTQISVTLLAAALTCAVMIGRLIYAWCKGLWHAENGIAWYDESLKPERTTGLSMGFLALAAVIFGPILGIDPPDHDPTLSVILALMSTGGLISALITNPHELIERAHTAARSSN